MVWADILDFPLFEFLDCNWIDEDFPGERAGNARAQMPVHGDGYSASADRVERWPLERLIPYANNPRSHSEADLDKIAAAIRKWGWTMPVLADEAGGLISGHARVGAAAKLGLDIDPGDRCARLERGRKARLSGGR